MVKSLVFGGNVSESLASYDQESQLWKTYQLSLFGGLIPYLVHFPKSGMMRNGVLYQLHNLVHLTYEKDGFVLPTPRASQDYKPIRRLSPTERNGTHGKTLVAEIGERFFLGSLPTPNSSDPNKYQTTQTQFDPTGKNFHLNPQFVTEMMGFPINWLNLQP